MLHLIFKDASGASRTYILKDEHYQLIQDAIVEKMDKMQAFVDNKQFMQYAEVLLHLDDHIESKTN